MKSSVKCSSKKKKNAFSMNNRRLKNSERITYWFKKKNQPLK